MYILDEPPEKTPRFHSQYVWDDGDDYLDLDDPFEAENQYQAEEAKPEWSPSDVLNITNKEQAKSYIDKLLERAGLNVKEAAQQTKHFPIEALGAYGNLYDLLSGGVASGLEAVGVPESVTRYKSPKGKMFPTSRDVAEAFGAPPKPTTFLGELSERGSKIAGSMAPFGGFGGLTKEGVKELGKQSIKGAVAGTTAKTAGLSEPFQAVAEIGGTFAPSAKTAFEGYGSAKDKIKKLKEMGLTESSLSLAQHAYDNSKALFKTAGSSIEQAYEKMSAEARSAFRAIWDKQVPLSKEGLAEVESQLYGEVRKQAKGVHIDPGAPGLTDIMENIDQRLQQHPLKIGKGDEYFDALEDAWFVVHEGLTPKGKKQTVTGLIDNIQRVNAHWDEYAKYPEIKKMMSEYKEGLYKTIETQAPGGKQIADDLRKANLVHMKVLDQRKAIDIASPWITTDGKGIDWNALSKSVNTDKTRKILAEATSAKTVTELSDLADVMVKLENAVGSPTGGHLQSVITGLVGASAKELLSGGTGGIMTALLGLGSAYGSKRIAAELLTNPKWRSLATRMGKAILRNKPAEATRYRYMLKNLIDQQQDEDKEADYNGEKEPSKEEGSQMWTL